jgi:hypothetical protein
MYFPIPLSPIRPLRIAVSREYSLSSVEWLNCYIVWYFCGAFTAPLWSIYGLQMGRERVGHGAGKLRPAMDKAAIYRRFITKAVTHHGNELCGHGIFQ